MFGKSGFYEMQTSYLHLLALGHNIKQSQEEFKGDPKKCRVIGMWKQAQNSFEKV